MKIVFFFYPIIAVPRCFINAPLIFLLFISLAAYEATEWAKNKNAGNVSTEQGQQSNYDLFRLAARNMESTYTHSMDIQEKYNIR